MINFMERAIHQAKQGRYTGGIPIGAVLVHNLSIVGQGYNKRVQYGSAIGHAEMIALENAGRQKAEFYKQCTMYTTLSPCIMCVGAILLYGIPKVVIGENANFVGAEHLLARHHVQVTVMQNAECISMLGEFIAANPALWNEDIGI